MKTDNFSQQGDGPIGLVLAPTRELAMQIQEECLKFGRNAKISSACVFGGADRYGQQRELNRGNHIVVATPGRLLDFLEAGVINLKRVTYLVLDEADRMLVFVSRKYFVNLYSGYGFRAADQENPLSNQT